MYGATLHSKTGLKALWPFSFTRPKRPSFDRKPALLPKWPRQFRLNKNITIEKFSDYASLLLKLKGVGKENYGGKGTSRIEENNYVVVYSGRKFGNDEFYEMTHCLGALFITKEIFNCKGIVFFLSKEGRSYRPFDCFEYFSGFYSSKLVSSHDCFVVSDLKKVRKYFGRLVDVFSLEENRLKTAIYLYMLGKQTLNFQIRFIVFTSCMEVLFTLSGEGAIGEHLRKRAALFLETNHPSKRATHDMVNKIYQLRSDFVHTASPRRRLSPHANHLLYDLEILLRRTLTKILDSPSSSTQFTSSDNTMRNYWLNLTLGT